MHKHTSLALDNRYVNVAKLSPDCYWTARTPEPRGAAAAAAAQGARPLPGDGPAAMQQYRHTIA